MVPDLQLGECRPVAVAGHVDEEQSGPQVIPAWEPTPQPRTSTPFPDLSVIVPIRFFLDSGISNVYTDHEIDDLS